MGFSDLIGFYSFSQLQRSSEFAFDSAIERSREETRGKRRVVTLSGEKRGR